MKRFLILSIFIWICLSEFSFAQVNNPSVNDPFTNLLQKLNTYNEKYPQEKVHLHLDKPYYAAGDDIWFKAYLLNTFTSGLSTISGTLYVELINEKDALEKQLKLPVISGVSWGDFNLADTLAEGNYRIRAYTQWMKNAGPEYFFDKVIKIGNSTMKKPAGKRGQEKKRAVDVQFFAEGGNLVEGLPNKLGIKAVGTSGLGEDISGVITDNDGKEVTTFSTTHLGMGNLTITPQPGKTYTARVKYKDGTENKTALPKALKSGYVLSIDQNADQILVKVSMTPDLLNKGSVKLVAQHNSNERAVLKANTEQQVIATAISKKEMPSGIVQLTLFSPDNLPVCERLVFVNNVRNKISTTISSVSNTHSIKGETELQLESILNEQPVQGAFSIAVTNTAAVTPDELNESNIFTSMLLTSDLSGYIEKPNYYFLNTHEETQKDLDNLMLTQGWRRVLWKNIISGTDPKITYQPEKSLKVSGTITTGGGKPIPNSRVSLLASSGGSFLADSLVTDVNGRFSFDELVFTDSTKFIVQARTPKGKSRLQIKLDPITGQLVNKNKNTGDLTINVNATLANYLEQSKGYFDELYRSGRKTRTISLKEVKIEAKKNPAKNSSNLNGPGNADAVITADKLRDCFSISQCLERFAVAGMIFKNGLPYLIRNGGAPMQIILDGIPIDSAAFMGISTANVQAVEILKDLSKTAVYGMKASNSGVIIITSKRAGDDIAAERVTPGIITVSPKGYDISREFYSPNYKVDKAANVADHRSTIYWNPNIITSETGKAKVSYFNSGDPGTYRVVVEGLDMLGNLAHAVYTYEVK